MLKGLAITPPVIGRISIGRVVERNGKRLPEKDDQFTITTQVQQRGEWVLHPLNESLRKAATGKLRAIADNAPFPQYQAARPRRTMWRLALAQLRSSLVVAAPLSSIRVVDD